MEKGRLRRADMITSILLFVYGSGLLYFSTKLMLRTLGKGKEWFNSAGLFPMIVAVFLLLCAVSLYRTARKDGARFDFLGGDKIVEMLKSKEFRVAAIVIGWLAFYIFVMLPIKWLPYTASTFIYLFVFMFYFNKKDLKSTIKTIIISAVATAMLTYGFGQLAMIPLP